jgi:AcrR family transcriptional regulator
MSKEIPRPYRSPSRQKQASATQSRILEAARELFKEKGFDGTTIDAIATEAGVAAPTVYAAFKSKRGIFMALLDGARFGTEYQALISEVQATTDPRERLTLSARISRQIYEAEAAMLDLLRGASAVSPELAKLVGEREERRRASQLPLIKELDAAAALHPGLNIGTAADLMWTLTSREVYRLLVLECSWSPTQYEQWLKDALRRELCAEQLAEPAK